MTLLTGLLLLILGAVTAPHVITRRVPALHPAITALVARREPLGLFAAGWGALGTLYGAIRLLGLLGQPFSAGHFLGRGLALVAAFLLLGLGLVLSQELIADRLPDRRQEEKLRRLLSPLLGRRDRFAQVALGLGGGTLVTAFLL